MVILFCVRLCHPILDHDSFGCTIVNMIITYVSYSILVWYTTHKSCRQNLAKLCCTERFTAILPSSISPDPMPHFASLFNYTILDYAKPQ